MKTFIELVGSLSDFLWVIPVIIVMLLGGLLLIYKTRAWVFKNSGYIFKNTFGKYDYEIFRDYFSSCYP